MCRDSYSFLLSQRCSRVLLVEKDRGEFLKKMRNPRAGALQKSAIMKKVRDKCKLSRCPRCEYRNGNLVHIVLITLFIHTDAW
jgi:hypothetical protein